MPKKASNKSNSEINPNPKATQSTSKDDKATKVKPTKETKVDEQDNFTILLKSTANKISPKSEGEIGYEIVKDDKAALYLRLSSNTSSGNFCKTPVLLKTVIDILAKQDVTDPFTSKIMKDVFQGKGSKNSNNTSFLMAACRSKDMMLIVSDTDKPLTSRLHKDFKSHSEKLLAMK